MLTKKVVWTCVTHACAGGSNSTATDICESRGRGSTRSTTYVNGHGASDVHLPDSNFAKHGWHTVMDPPGSHGGISSSVQHARVTPTDGLAQFVYITNTHMLAHPNPRVGVCMHMLHVSSICMQTPTHARPHARTRTHTFRYIARHIRMHYMRKSLQVMM